MIQTIRFRLHPTSSQENRLHEIFAIYNSVKRKGYRLLFKLKDTNSTRKEKWRIIQPQLMEFCHNNPYVNSILKDNEAKLAQQQTWYKKRRKYMKRQIVTINNKIEYIKEKNKRDRRLKGLYSRLSSAQNRLFTLQFKPVVFGTKRLFRERILRRINRDEFKIRRDSSFCCIGKKQGKNLNLKVLPSMVLKVHTFSKEKGKKWLFIPFTVNVIQERWFEDILKSELYTVEVIRRFIKGELRYFAHISYKIPRVEPQYSFKDGAIGLDMNYNFVSLSNTDKCGNLKSYHEITFRNLHSYRKNKRADYVSYKMDKVVNYCINKKKGLIIEALSLDQEFSYGKERNKKLSNFKTSALDILERKCFKSGIAIKKVHPAYTSLIGKYKYSRSRNLSTHILASYVIARKGLGFKEGIPAIYKWLLAQVGGFIKPRLKPSSPYYNWAKIHDFFKYSGITSYKTSEVMKKTLQMKYVLNPATGAQPDNLMADLSPTGKVDDWHKFWNYIKISNFL